MIWIINHLRRAHRGLIHSSALRLPPAAAASASFRARKSCPIFAGLAAILLDRASASFQARWSCPIFAGMAPIFQEAPEPA